MGKMLKIDERIEKKKSAKTLDELLEETLKHNPLDTLMDTIGQAIAEYPGPIEGTLTVDGKPLIITKTKKELGEGSYTNHVELRLVRK